MKPRQHLAKQRSAGFQTCCIADFQVGSAVLRPAGLETRDTADLEVCATLDRYGRAARRPGRSRSQIPCRASVLIIVMWVAFGLVAITLYFAHAMLMELKAADDQVANMESEQIIEGAVVYVSNILANRSNMMCIPTAANFRAKAVKVGDGKFWLVGRDTNDLQSSGQAAEPFWGLVDKASKVNLNSTNPTKNRSVGRVFSSISPSVVSVSNTSTTPS